VKPEVSETTQLLLAWADGDEAALHALTPDIYRYYWELHGLTAAVLKVSEEAVTRDQGHWRVPVQQDVFEVRSEGPLPSIPLPA
jgi:hypothetical protein